MNPRSCRRGITPFHDDASAQSPCTSTMVGRGPELFSSPATACPPPPKTSATRTRTALIATMRPSRRVDFDALIMIPPFRRMSVTVTMSRARRDFESANTPAVVASPHRLEPSWRRSHGCDARCMVFRSRSRPGKGEPSISRSSASQRRDARLGLRWPRWSTVGCSWKRKMPGTDVRAEHPARARRRVRGARRPPRCGATRARAAPWCSAANPAWARRRCSTTRSARLRTSAF